MIRFQKISFIYISEFAKAESGKYSTTWLTIPKRMRVQLSQEFLQKKTFT